MKTEKKSSFTYNSTSPELIDANKTYFPLQIMSISGTVSRAVGRYVIDDLRINFEIKKSEKKASIEFDRMEENNIENGIKKKIEEQKGALIELCKNLDIENKSIATTNNIIRLILGSLSSILFDLEPDNKNTLKTFVDTFNSKNKNKHVSIEIEEISKNNIQKTQDGYTFTSPTIVFTKKKPQLVEESYKIPSKQFSYKNDAELITRIINQIFTVEDKQMIQYMLKRKKVV